MKFQYSTDDRGEPAGVFIPIREWNELKSRFKDIEKESIEIPAGHKEVVQERIELYKRNPNQIQDINKALDEIESEL